MGANPVRKTDISNFFVISAKMSILSATFELYRQEFKYIGENQNISTFAQIQHTKKDSPWGESCYPPMYGGDGGTCYSMLSSWH